MWVKATCPERMSRSPPPYEDVLPFQKALIENFPDRVIYGTDWPHPNMKKSAPDDGLLVDRIPLIAPTAELQRKLLIDNPMRLYWDDLDYLHAPLQSRAALDISLKYQAIELWRRRGRSAPASCGNAGRIWRVPMAREKRDYDDIPGTTCSTPNARARDIRSIRSACR